MAEGRAVVYTKGSAMEENKVHEFEKRFKKLEKSVDQLVEGSIEVVGAARSLVGFVKSITDIHWGHKLAYLVGLYEIVQAHLHSPASIVNMTKSLFGG